MKVVVFSIKGVDGTLDSYCVVGKESLDQYRDVECTDDCRAFIRNNAIRARLLAAAQPPADTLNLGALARVVGRMDCEAEDIDDNILTTSWRIPVSG